MNNKTLTDAERAHIKWWLTLQPEYIMHVSPFDLTKLAFLGGATYGIDEVMKLAIKPGDDAKWKEFIDKCLL